MGTIGRMVWAATKGFGIAIILALALLLLARAVFGDETTRTYPARLGEQDRSLNPIPPPPPAHVGVDVARDRSFGVGVGVGIDIDSDDDGCPPIPNVVTASPVLMMASPVTILFRMMEDPQFAEAARVALREYDKHGVERERDVERDVSSYTQTHSGVGEGK